MLFNHNLYAKGSQMKDNKKQTKPLTGHLDKWLQSTGTRLASKTPRRTFIGRLTTGIIAIGGTSLILKPGTAQAACTPTQCYGTYNVNVCYSPWKIVAAEAGQSGLVLRKGPSFSADPVTYNNSTNPVVMSVGSHFGRCSNRDGGVSNGCPDPGPRPNQFGFIWGYWVDYAKQGWMPYSVNGVTYAVGDNGYTGTLCGPANFDFDCRYAKSACSQYHGCGGSGVNPTCNGYYADLDAYDPSPSDERFYLRYAPDSTAFMWLEPVNGSQPADTVQVYGNMNAAGYNWSCISVVCARWVPNGCRGWIRSDALGVPVPKRANCYPSIACPNS
jgi:hypothetical protein